MLGKLNECREFKTNKTKQILKNETLKTMKWSSGIYRNEKKESNWWYYHRLDSHLHQCIKYDERNKRCWENEEIPNNSYNPP